MTLILFPVTIIDEIPHLLLHYDFLHKKNRYFLSALRMKTSSEDRIIDSLDFLDIDRTNFQQRSRFYSLNNENSICVLNVDHRFSNRIQIENKVFLWICIRDLLNGLITFNNNLKTSTIFNGLTQIDRTLTKRHDFREEKLDDVKNFKNQIRQFVWDLMQKK